MMKNYHFEKSINCVKNNKNIKKKRNKENMN